MWSNKMYWYAVAVIFVFDVWDLAAAQNHCRPKDCYDLKCYNVSTAKDGPHTIYPGTPDLPSLPVSCDQETDGGGWIMYLRRLDGTVNFTKNWEAYKRGFGQNGNSTTELWLGNENVYQVLQSYGTTECELRIEVDAWDEKQRWLVATNFRMKNESSQYTLDWDDVIGPYPDLYTDWNYHKLLDFRTIDSENQACVGLAGKWNGGWWYGDCTQVFLTGQYFHEETETYKSIMTWSFKKKLSLKRARMMLRPSTIRPCNNPCKNGGTCEHVADPIGHHCACTFGWCGSTCEVDNPCNNGGTCETNAMTGTTTCTCAAEFTGLTCFEDVTLEETTGEDTTFEHTTRVDVTLAETTGEDTPFEHTTRVDVTLEETTAEDTAFEDPTRVGVNRDDTPDMTSERMTGEHTTGEDTPREDVSRHDTPGMTGGRTIGDDSTGEDTPREDVSRHDTPGMTGGRTIGDDSTGEDTPSEDVSRHDTPGMTGGNTTSVVKYRQKMEAFGISSATFDTANCGLMVSLLILRRRL